MKKKPTRKKLALSTETLRKLTGAGPCDDIVVDTCESCISCLQTTCIWKCIPEI